LYNHLKKTKNVLANGKIIITDFRKLRREDFPAYRDFSREEFWNAAALCSPDGQLYISSRRDCCEVLAAACEALMGENYKGLLAWQKYICKKYPRIKSFDDIGMMAADAEGIPEVIVGLCVPIEMMRREIEKQYYGKRG